MEISQIKPNPDNPRVIKDDKFDKLCKSIKEFPKMMELRPIIVDSNMIILAGNMRLRALQHLGYKEIPDNWVKKASDLTDEQKKEFIIKDNVGFGDWEWDMLANEWDVDQLKEWGLDLPEWGGEELEAKEDDFDVPEGGIETDIVLGDLFEIGQHRLLCGDSTDSDQVARLMNGEKAELCFTSPPYSDMRTYEGNKDLSVKNLIEFIPTFLPFAEYQVINLGIQRKDNEVVQYWDDYIQKAKDCGYLFLSWNVWKKPNAGSIANQTAMFPIEHEWLFVFGKNRKENNAIIPNINAGVKKRRHFRKADGEIYNGEFRPVKEHRPIGTVIDVCQEVNAENNKMHPAMVPVGLPSEYIKAMTNEGQIVTEPFTGSGSTMVAAHQLNRKCHGMELEPKYCQVIVDRMKKLDKTLTIKRNGKYLG